MKPRIRAEGGSGDSFTPVENTTCLGQGTQLGPVLPEGPLPGRQSRAGGDSNQERFSRARPAPSPASSLPASSARMRQPPPGSFP